MALGSIKDIYSTETTDAQKKLNEAEANKPGAYQSNWGNTINNLMDKIVNQKDFSYDFNVDPLYQQYKDQYTQMGKQAAMDTQANAATLTGGFGNSYAATAATQANQQYLTQLNNVIPQLYGLALDKYKMDTENLYNKVNALGSQEDREYGKYRDTVSDWKDDRNYYYGKYSDSIGNDQFVANYNQSEDQFNQNMAYNRERDAIEDAQWQKQFDYTQSRDGVSDNQWQQQFDYQKYRDGVSDSQWEKQYALSLARARRGSGSGTKSKGKTDTKRKAAIEKENDDNYQFYHIMEKMNPIYAMTGNADADSQNAYLNNMVKNGLMSAELAQQIYNFERERKK